jgi:hypothetical protein
VRSTGTRSTAAPIIDPAFTVRPVTVGEIVLTYMSQPKAGATPPSGVKPDSLS